MLYVVGSELTSETGPNRVYHDLLERLKLYPKVQDQIGLPLRGYHEHHSRGRGTHRVKCVNHYTRLTWASHQLSDDGTRMQIRFNIEGPNGKAAVTGEMHLEEGSSTGKHAKWYPYVLYYETISEQGRSKRVFLEDSRPPKEIKQRKKKAKIIEKDDRLEKALGPSGKPLPSLGFFDRK